MMIPRGLLELGAYATVALVAASLLAGRLPPFLEVATRWLERPLAPVIVGILTGLFYWWVWGSLNAVPVVHDEAAYLLQAEIFAHGRWAMPGPPLPHFFEQFHVFVTPVLAPKYPPGHALALLPGVVLGLPGLMPIILNGLTGGLLFALARRLVNPWVALLTWLLWLVAPASVVFRQSYFSELTTGFLILLAWWALLDWRESTSLKSMLVIAGAFGWAALTRPVTALAFAIPIGIYVVWRTIQRRAWRQLALGAALGTAILALIPLQNASVTGEWRKLPLSYYSKVYFPFDLPGFTVDHAPPQRELPPDMVQFRQYFMQYHEAHTVAALPGVLFERVQVWLQSNWGNWRVALTPLALIGLIGLSLEAGFALVSVVVLLLAYLVFAHPPGWTLYYVEGQVVIAFITALGVWRASQWVMRAQRRGREVEASASLARGGLVVCALAVLAFPVTKTFVEEIRGTHDRLRVRPTYFREILAQIPSPAVVFVRYADTHNFHFSFITNGADLETAKTWVVYDRGSENVELLAQAPGRTPYLFEEQTGRLLPMDPTTGDIARVEPQGPIGIERLGANAP